MIDTSNIEFDFDLDIDEEDEEEIQEAIEKLTEWAEKIEERNRERAERILGDGFYIDPKKYNVDTDESDDVDIEGALEEADIDADEIAEELEASDDSDDETGDVHVNGEPVGEVRGFSISVDDGSAPSQTCEGPTSRYYQVDDDGTVEVNNPGDSGGSEDSSEDADEPSFVYECPRSWTDDDGDTEHCDGVHESTKDYGETLLRACPECGKEVTLIRGK